MAKYMLTFRGLTIDEALKIALAASEEVGTFVKEQLEIVEDN